MFRHSCNSLACSRTCKYPTLIICLFRLCFSSPHAGIIIVVLLLIVVTCFTTSYVFQALQQNFNSNCVSSALVVFKHVKYRSNAIAPFNNNRSIAGEQKVNGLWKEFKSYYRSEDHNTTDEFTSADLYEYLNNGPTIFRTTTERSNLTVEEQQILNSRDSDFFKNCKLQMRASRMAYA